MPKPKPKAKARKPAPAASTPPSTADEVERQLARIRARLAADDAAADTAKMGANVYSKLTTEYRGFLKLRNEIESKQAISEDKLASHPKFIALRDSIISALIPFPQAAQAVIDQLGAKPHAGPH